MKVSAVLPTYNEAKNIAELIRQIRKYVSEPEIIVVDDNSPDRTWEIAQKEGAKVIRRTEEKGLSSAIWAGVKAASGDAVIWMDCDLCHPPSLIPQLLESLESCDIAVGSRFIKGGKDKRKFSRWLTSKTFNTYANLILQAGVKDINSGFVAVKKEVFSKVSIATTNYGEYFVEFIYDSLKAGYKVKEVPYIFTDRSAGDSKTGESIIALLKHSKNYALHTLRLRFR